MKKIKLFGLLLLFAAAMSFTACSDDDLSSTSIFPEQKVEDSKFNNWLTKNYVQPYNIDFKYRYSDKESDRNYNVIPAKYENAIAIEKLMKYMWIDSYVECAGREFLCTYTPRVIQLTGSYKYDTNGSIVAGSAEQGMKVMLQMAEDVKNGRNFIIFPEGTRSRDGNHLLPFKGGSFKCATKANCPIVPVALLDSYKAFDTGSVAKQTVQVHFLDPIYPEEYQGMKTTQIAELVRTRIEEKIQACEMEKTE